MTNSVVAAGRCQCGEVQFQLTAKPFMHAYCHCTICQEFNQSAYSDIALVRRKDVVGLDESRLDWKVYAWPPMVNRGKCKACGAPAIEFGTIPGVPRLAIIPMASLPEPGAAPDPSLHIFYHRRVQPVDDSLPKYSGYLASQLGFFKHLIKALWRS